MIQTQNLSVQYSDGTLAINDVSIRIADGESVALIGSNGAGKTTFFYSILGFVEISSGSIHINELEVLPGNYRTLREKVGLVFQNSDDQLFMPTIAEDIAFGLKQHGENDRQAAEKTIEIMEKLGIAGLQEKVPYKISGGEKRLAALAGVLVMEPELLLLDEPSSFLDPRSRRNVIQLLRSIPTSKIIATHDLDLAWELCDRTIVLSDGKLAADGATKDILSDENELVRNGLEFPLGLQRKGTINN